MQRRHDNKVTGPKEVIGVTIFGEVVGEGRGNGRGVSAGEKVDGCKGDT